MGSGLVAGESSATYDETFTHTYVTVRSVGIGAYSGRLGHRVIQNENAATTILASFSARNNCLVHDVCLSNNQLGCAKSMHPNGTKQLVVQDDAHGISAARDWLIFVTVACRQTLPIVESRDAVTRKIEGFPPPDGQWSDNAVIEYFVRLGKPEFYLSRQRLSQ
jgi:acetyl-CoA carboxylase / biotin carboxylase 1